MEITNGEHTATGFWKIVGHLDDLPETRMDRGFAGVQLGVNGLSNVQHFRHLNSIKVSESASVGQPPDSTLDTPKPAWIGHLREIVSLSNDFPGESTAVCREFFKGLFRELLRELFRDTDRAQGVNL